MPGRAEVFVRPFPDVTKQKWRLSGEGGGTQPLWARDGKELFYLAPDGALMSVQVRAGQQLGAGHAYQSDGCVVSTAGRTLTIARTYDVALDGKRFLRIKPGAASEAAPITVVVVQNWLEELKRLVPPPK